MERVSAATEVDRAFLYTDALQIGIGTFSNTLRSAEYVGEVCRLHETIKLFPDLIHIIFRSVRYGSDGKGIGFVKTTLS
jgi:hypothetical protein